MSKFQLLTARARVVLTGFVTWLVVLNVIVVDAARLLGEYAPPGWAGAIQALGSIAAVVGTAIAIIRRVTQVLPEERGLLPVAGGPTPTPDDEFQPDQ